MFTRLLDNVLPAFVLFAMVVIMAMSFGGLSPNSASRELRTVALERVVITAARADHGTLYAQAAASSEAR